MNTHLGKILRNLREDRGLTQNDVALKAGLSVRHYQDIEYGNRMCRIDTLNRVLGVHGHDAFSFHQNFVLDLFYARRLQKLKRYMDEKTFLCLEVSPEGQILKGPLAENEGSSETLRGEIFIWDLFSFRFNKDSKKTDVKELLSSSPERFSWEGSLKTHVDDEKGVRTHWNTIRKSDGSVVYDVLLVSRDDNFDLRSHVLSQMKSPLE